ncbi:hypothetical protein SAMN04488058_10819 [Deinococcus reticulitermitis]|uniref:DNA damage response protein DdrC n=2 Tax=Deinococcus reticulitermitis TaxID=856736 RepID=A0A1H6YR09_9DEIO|nr:hypothetical protein SAMN04488058_10819 [Deinococcus reticulitermitis]
MCYNICMKNAPLTLTFGSVQLPVSADGLLHAESVQRQLGLPHLSWDAVLIEHALPETYRDFGGGLEAAISVADFALLAFALETPEARRWQKRARELLVRTLQGDVKLAAHIADRAAPESRRWLAARLESTGARRELLSTVARHGGVGTVYGQLGSISNRAVLGKNSAAVRQERGVKSTRDGLTSEELLRLAYIDTVTARAIQEGAAQGNAAILRLHEQVARRERQSWEGFAARAG